MKVRETLLTSTWGGQRRFGDLPHGSPSTYRNWRCRCDACVAANTANCFQNKERRAARLRQGRVAVPHGRYSTYINYGCRCGPCIEAQRLHEVDYRARRAAS